MLRLCKPWAQIKRADVDAIQIKCAQKKETRIKRVDAEAIQNKGPLCRKRA